MAGSAIIIILFSFVLWCSVICFVRPSTTYPMVNDMLEIWCNLKNTSLSCTKVNEKEYCVGLLFKNKFFRRTGDISMWQYDTTQVGSSVLGVLCDLVPTNTKAATVLKRKTKSLFSKDDVKNDAIKPIFSNTSFKLQPNKTAFGGNANSIFLPENDDFNVQQEKDVHESKVKTTSLYSERTANISLHDAEEKLLFSHENYHSTVLKNENVTAPSSSKVGKPVEQEPTMQIENEILKTSKNSDLKDHPGVNYHAYLQCLAIVASLMLVFGVAVILYSIIKFVSGNLDIYSLDVMEGHENSFSDDEMDSIV